MKRFSIFAIAIMIAIGIQSQTIKLVGTWNEEGATRTWIFNADGTKTLKGSMSVQLPIAGYSVPCELVSYDLTYKTVLNEPLDNLSISQIRTNIPLAQKDSEEELTLKPYTQQLLNLLQSTSSNISPIRATVILHFRDVNKNDIYREASFLLYKYESTSTSE